MCKNISDFRILLRLRVFTKLNFFTMNSLFVKKEREKVHKKYKAYEKRQLSKK